MFAFNFLCARQMFCLATPPTQVEIENPFVD